MKKKKCIPKLALLLSILLLSAGLAGCGGSGPEAAVKDFFKAAQAFDLETMEESLRDEETGLEGPDGDDMDLDDLFNDDDFYGTYFQDYLAENAEKISYEIIEVSQDKNQAKVTVSCRYVDASGPLMRSFTQSFTQLMEYAFSGKEPSEREIEEIFQESLAAEVRDSQEEYKEKDLTIALVKYEGDWLIDPVTEDLLDLVFSGFISAGQEMAQSF